MTHNYFIFNDPDTRCTSTFISGTAVCSADLEEGRTDARQSALLERRVYDDGEIQDVVWFGWELPASAEDVADIYDDHGSSDSDWEVVATFASEVPYKSWDFSGGILAGK